MLAPPGGLAPPPREILDPLLVNKRAVRILLECILVFITFGTLLVYDWPTEDHSLQKVQTRIIKCGKLPFKQECIPVGCVPPATVATIGCTGGGSVREGLCVCVWGGGKISARGKSLPGGLCDRDLHPFPLSTEWQTRVKTFPCPKLRFAVGNNIFALPSFFNSEDDWLSSQKTSFNAGKWTKGENYSR